MGKLSALWDLAKKEGADLADDAASRMARAAEQGYGDTFYHATDKDFTEFMPSGWRGTNSFAPTPEGAIRGANSGGAEHVAIAGAGNPNTIYPVRMRGKIYGQDAPPDWWLPESVTYGEYRDILAKNKELPIPDEIAAQLNQNQIEQLQYMRRNDALNNYKEGVPESEWGKYAVYNDKGMVIDTSADMPMKLATEYTPPKPFMYQDIEGPQGYKSSWVDDYPGDRRDLLQKIGYTGARVDDEGGKSISMFDPSAIRSVNAAFDPAKKDSANLLAGIQSAIPSAATLAKASTAAYLTGQMLAPEDAEAGVGAATTTALAPEMYRQMEETRRVVSDFAQRRAPKASFWKQKRDELLELAGAGIGAAVSAGINTVASNPLTSALAFQGGRYLKASEQPVQGVSALTALIASGDLNTAANVARMPQEQIADEAGGLVTDYLSQAGYPGIAPAAGTAVNVGINMAGF